MNHSQALRLALDALGKFSIGYHVDAVELNDLIATLESALERPEQTDWQHLKRYGYAPGNYMSKCHSCGDVPVMDKRAITCRSCAEAMHAAALEQLEQDWEDLYRKEKARADMWRDKYESLAGPDERVYPQPEQLEQPEPLKGWKLNHARKHPDEEGVAEIGYLDPEDDRFAPILTVDTGLYYQDAQALPLAVAILSMLSAHPPRREWRGLTEEEREQATGWSVEHIEAALKERNA